MNAREKDLLKFVGKAVVWKDVVFNNNEVEYKSIASTCVGYSLESGLLIVSVPSGIGCLTEDKLDPVFDVVVYPSEKYLFVHPDRVEMVW